MELSLTDGLWASLSESLLHHPPPAMVLLIVMGALVLILFWLVVLLHLMSSPDRAFVGRFDKVLWLVLMVMFPVLGPVAYVMNRMMTVTNPKH